MLLSIRWLPGLLFAALLWLTAAAHAESARLERTECPAALQEVAAAEAARLRCHWLMVPENRAAADSPQVAVFVLWLAARGAGGHAPILHLAGGPGDAASASLGEWLGSAVHREYDLILMDPRGSGFSRPSLDCPEFVQARRVRACRERLLSAGIDLSAYHSAAVVRDAHDLLLAFDLAAVNLYGVSYGSRWALQLAGEFPQRVRAVVLDGAYPPAVNAALAQSVSAHQALERLFADCAAQAACSRAHPDLQAAFYGAVERMNARPAVVPALEAGYAVRMSGDDFVRYVLGIMADAVRLPQLPALVDAYARGAYDEVAVQVAAGGDARHSAGLHLSVRCAEDLPAGLPPSEADLAAVPAVLADALRDERIAADCALWDVPPAAGMHAPAVRAPTLILSGGYDPVTPPQWGALTAAGLQKSWHYVFPNGGHGVLPAEGCAAMLVLSFLEEPAGPPNADCFAGLGAPVFQMRG